MFLGDTMDSSRPGTDLAGRATEPHITSRCALTQPDRMALERLSAVDETQIWQMQEAVAASGPLWFCLATATTSAPDSAGRITQPKDPRMVEAAKPSSAGTHREHQGPPGNQQI